MNNYDKYHINELLEIRFSFRKEGCYKLSDSIRNYLDDKLIFVFDLKDEYETYYLTDNYFKNMKKIEIIRNIKFKSKRDFVEFRIKQDIQAEKLFDAWLYIIQNKNIK